MRGWICLVFVVASVFFLPLFLGWLVGADPLEVREGAPEPNYGRQPLPEWQPGTSAADDRRRERERERERRESDQEEEGEGMQQQDKVEVHEVGRPRRRLVLAHAGDDRDVLGRVSGVKQAQAPSTPPQRRGGHGKGDDGEHQRGGCGGVGHRYG